MSKLKKELVCAYVSAFNSGNIEKLCSLFHHEALVWGVLGWGKVEEVRPIWEDLIRCFGIQLQIEAIVCEHELLAARYIERGRSVASFRGGPVTDQSYEIVAMEWFEIRRGKVYRRWGARDSASQFRQMGLPLPGEGPKEIRAGEPH
ncbi:MAG: nuclear transport factor 2 family protein [Planctomycetota bacterium]